MKKNSGVFSRILTSLILIVSLCLMISVADLLSSFITVGGFTFVSDEVTLSKFSIYALSTSNHQTLVLAEDDANNCIMQGGAGYIYIDNNYYVIASMYENEADAEKVKTTLLETKPQAYILTINIPAINITSNLSSQEKNTLQDTLSIFKTTFQKLYDISVGLDTSVIKEINARLSVNELASTVTTTCDNFETVFLGTKSTNLLTIKKSINDLKDKIDLLVNNSKTPYTSYIKYAYCETIFIYKNLAESLINN